MHKSHEQLTPRFAVCTVSDTRTVETDEAGQMILQLVSEQGFAINHYAIVKDELADLQSLVTSLAARDDLDVVIFTGGTGFTPRDVTDEAIAPAFQKDMHSFGELFRMRSYEYIGARAMLSRAVAGTINQKMIYLLPGSTKAVELAMVEFILPTVQHIVGEMHRL